MIHPCAIKGTTFNWSDKLESSFKSNIRRARHPTEGEQLKFHMASYLVDDIYAKFEFEA